MTTFNDLLELTDLAETAISGVFIKELREELLVSFKNQIEEDVSIGYIVECLGKYLTENPALTELEKDFFPTFEKIDSHLRKFRKISLQEWVESL